MGISLEKGQRISLVKAGEQPLTHVFMGLGWDAVKPKGFLNRLMGETSIDLDASCLLYDKQKELLDVVFFNQLKSQDGSIQHTGDNRTGDGDGDDESIRINLSTVPAHVHTLIFTINSFQGQTFNKVENAFCRLVNAVNNHEIARYTLSGGGAYTGYIMARLYRHNEEWKLAAIGEPGHGRTFIDMQPQIQPYL